MRKRSWNDYAKVSHYTIAICKGRQRNVRRYCFGHQTLCLVAFSLPLEDKTTREWQTLNGLMKNATTTTQSQQGGDLEHATEVRQMKYACAANKARCPTLNFAISLKHLQKRATISHYLSSNQSVIGDARRKIWILGAARALFAL